MAASKLVYLAILSFTSVALLTFLAYSSSDRLDTWRVYRPVAAAVIVATSETITPSQQDFSAGNSTLGFEAILALSQGTKWRVDGIHAAARASGIEVEVPPQPGWSEAFVHAFHAVGTNKADGAAKAWLAHIDLLKYVITRGYGSALIMEDDTDWDVDVRSQTRLIAPAVRNLTHANGSDTTDQNIPNQPPYGLNWDILWMGHCSDPPNADDPMVIYQDPTVVSHALYHGLNRYITEVLKEGQRSVHYSWNPVCTFAYAVSAQGARKLLAQASLGKGGAFDLMLMHACQDKVVDCISVNPEIFDPYHPAGGDSSEVRAADKGEVASAESGAEMGRTDNILRSARCAGLFGSTCSD